MAFQGLLGAVGGMLVLALTAVYADKYFAKALRVPVWWGIDRQVRWFATRRVGLAVIPLLGAAVLIAALGTGATLFHMVGVSFVLLLAYLIYLQAVDKNLAQ